VLLPRAVRPSWLARLRAHWPFVAGPAAALTGVTFLPRVASPSRAVSPRVRSSSCRYSPCWASPGRRGGHDWRLIPVVPALFAFAWGASNSPPEEAAALVLVSLSCVALATIVVAAVPGAVAKAGIVAWAATDLALAVANHLEQASRAITNAAPAVGPLASLHLQRLQLQRVVLGLSRSSTPTSSSRRFSEPCSPPTVATADWRASSAPAQRPR
jgi:hypothetical protein